MNRATDANLLPGGKNGNKSFANHKRWQQALTKALADEGGGDADKGLLVIAKQCVAAAKGGDMRAMREIGDRFDGKPAQAVELSGPDGGPMEIELSDEDIARRIAFVLAKASKGMEKHRG